MNIRRGLFRLWVIFAALFVLGVSAASYNTIREEFRVANTDFEAIAKQFGGVPLLPVSCEKARGTAATDYSMDRGYCWYEMPKFRALYPEYQDLDDKKLSDRLYGNAGMLRSPRPWTKLAETILLAVGGPLAVLTLGWSLLWAFSGFANPKAG